jgi:hypothetical protein
MWNSEESQALHYSGQLVTRYRDLWLGRILERRGIYQHGQNCHRQQR